jgi:hypothetical protein
MRQYFFLVLAYSHALELSTPNLTRLSCFVLTLPLFPADSSESSSGPLVRISRDAFHVGHFVVLYPSSHELGKFMQSVLHGDGPFPAGEFSDFILQAFDSVGGYFEVDFSVFHVEAVSQKCLSEEVTNAALFAVHFEL